MRKKVIIHKDISKSGGHAKMAFSFTEEPVPNLIRDQDQDEVLYYPFH